MSEVLLQEWLVFLNNGIDGRKHFKGKMFVKAHEKTYVFDALKPFWEEYLDHQVKIDTLGEIMLGKEKVDITDKQCIGGVLRYPREGDTYGSKNLSKVLLNYKIPVFWRHMVPIVEKE